jgi:hypothetical protein
MAGALEIGEQHQRHEIAELQRRGSRIKTAVRGERALCDEFRKTRRRLLHEAAPLQFLQDVSGSHGGESTALLGFSADGISDASFAAYFAALRRPSPPVFCSLVV